MYWMCFSIMFSLHIRIESNRIERQCNGVRAEKRWHEHWYYMWRRCDDISNAHSAFYNMFGSLCCTRTDICIYGGCFIVRFGCGTVLMSIEHTASWVDGWARAKICVCAFHLLSFSMCLYIWFTCLLSCRFARSFVVLGCYSGILSIIDFVSRCLLKRWW